MPYRLMLVDPDPGMRYSVSDPGGFLNEPGDQKLRPKMAEALVWYAQQGWTIYAVTNQGGIGAEKMSFEAGEEIQAELMRMAPVIQGTLFCPDEKGAECWWKSPSGGCAPVHERDRFKGWNFRQPGSGMIDVLKTLMVPDEVLFVGSRTEDADSAKKAKVLYQTIDDWVAFWESSVLNTVQV